MKTMELTNYADAYSERGLWSKIACCTLQAGRKVLKLVLILYYELSDPTISLADKGVILGALGYFILPLDLIPDTIPVAGYTDDMAALTAAYTFIKGHVTPEIESKAEAKILEWTAGV